MNIKQVVNGAVQFDLEVAQEELHELESKCTAITQLIYALSAVKGLSQTLQEAANALLELSEVTQQIEQKVGDTCIRT